MTVRIAIGGLAQESHSFSPVPGSWQHFGPNQVHRGDGMFAAHAGTRTELGGAIASAQESGVELVPLIAAHASSSAGPMQSGVFGALRDELIGRLKEAGPVDGVLLVLHGALVVEGWDDGTGEILRAVRAAVGERLPVVGTLDLHANVTRRMVDEATALVGYHTAPHVDMWETGRRGMRVLMQTVCSDAHPEVGFCKLPMIAPGETARTTDGPYAEVMRMAEALAAQPGILDASVFSSQPWLDVPDVGCSAIVVCDGDPRRADGEARRLAAALWQRRDQFEVPLTPVSEAIERALGAERGPFVLADSADAPSSGAPGDSTVLIRALLQAAPSRDCLTNLVDPEAVQAMVDVGVGREITVSLGAAYAPQWYAPVEMRGRVRLISDGEFVQKGPGFHGAMAYRGRTAVLQQGALYVVVSEEPVRQWDPEFYRSVGLEPRDAQIVQVKSPAAFRAAYGPLAAEVLIVDAPGVCSPNLRTLPFRRVRRPLYPLDELDDWRPDPGKAM